MMRIMLVVTFALMITTLSVTLGRTQIRSDDKQGLLEHPIDNIDVEAPNMALLISNFSAQTKIPIGLEISPYDDLSITRTTRLQISHGSLRDVLNSIVKQNPLYTWKIQNDVVNILPNAENRDELLKKVLETKLVKFSFEQGTSRFTLKQSIVSAPAVKSILAQQNVRPDSQTFMSRDFDPLGSHYMLELSNVSVSEVLNRVIQDSQTKYWVILRYGKRKQYLVLNL